MKLYPRVMHVIALTAALVLSQCKSTSQNGGAELASAHSEQLQNGCYELILVGVGNGPLLCLDGTNEEGIGGAEVRVVIGKSTDLVSWCGSSTFSGFENKLYTIKVNIKGTTNSMVFSGSATDGKVKFGNSIYDYHYAPKFKAGDMFKNSVCQKAGVSGIVAESCTRYVASCNGGRSPVKCPGKFSCSEEIPGVNYPECVAENKLISDQGTHCSQPNPCMKCP